MVRSSEVSRGDLVLDGDFIEPPAAGFLAARSVEAAHAGFEIDHRCPVEEVDAGDLEDGSGYGLEPHDRDPDRIGMTGRARGEDAADAVVEERHHLEAARRAPVQVRDQVEMREPVDVAEPWDEVLSDLNPRSYLAAGDGLKRHSLEPRERRAHDADRAVTDCWKGRAGRHRGLPMSRDRLVGVV